MSDESVSSEKISLPMFLKVLTSNDVPASKAMAVAAKVYKTYNTPATLAQLTDLKLKAAGVDDKDVRKLVLTAIRKAGYKQAPTNDPVMQGIAAQKTSRVSGASTSGMKSRPTGQIAKSKRKRDDDLNELLPDRPSDEGATYGSLEFNEILDEEVLMSKFTVTNRAPIMTAWAFVVAERLGFQREEALSIASVYTEMNAISKGVSLGIYEKGKGKGIEAARGGSQPYIDLMGRRPLYQTASSQWRALSGESPVSPAAAFSYITRSLRQTTAQTLGALRLLAQSYTPAELNEKGFSLYADFRPDVDGWGKKGQVKCKTILDLRKKDAQEAVNADDRMGVDNVVKFERRETDSTPVKVEEQGPAQKKARQESQDTVDEFEAMWDKEFRLDVDLNFDDIP